MTRQIFIYMLAFGMLFFLGEYIHNSYIENQEIALGFSLRSMYAFHAFFSLQICIVFAVLSKNEKLNPQLGFIYLASFVLKIIAFGIFFYDPVITAEKLSKIQQVSLLIPMLLFLILEVCFIVRIFNETHSLK